MVFLNPAILLGLLAASIPIIIHLLNFRKLKKVEFSTLSFLKELQKSKIKNIKIKQWLLLLIRTLIIIFLVLAFARPTLESVNFIGSTGSAKSSVVFILDNSFSMSYVNDKGSIFNQSKKAIRDVLEKQQDGDEIFFITLSDSIKKTSNKENALQILEDIKITQLTGPLSSIIELAAETLTKSQNINKEIYLFTDFQKSTFFRKEKDSLKIKIDDIKLYSFNMSTVNPENFSVSNLKLENSIIELKKPLTFSASVNNFSDNPINNFSTSLFINNERVAQQNITLPSNGNKTIEFETNLKETGLIEARLELEEDNILEDNIAYYNFKVPEKINVLLVYDDVSEINFLEAALNSVTSSDRIMVTLKSISSIQFVKLGDFDIIFLVTSGNIAMPQLANYVKDGGSLVFFPSNNVEMNRINNLLNAIDLPKIDKIIQTNETELNFAEFDKIDFAHPIFKNLFSNSNKQQVESPNIFKYVKYFPSQTVKSIIQLNDKSLFLGEKNFGNGNILFFNISPELSSGNFPLKGIFAPIITKSVFYLSSNQNENKNYIVGETIPINFGNITFPILDVIFPGGSEKLNLQNLPTNVLEYNNDKIAGSYKFLDNNKLIDFAAVNTNPSESILEKLTDDQLTKYYTDLVGENYLMLNPKEDFLQKITKARYGTELWKLFLLLAFLLALIEMFISRSAKKDLMNLGQN